MPIKAAAHKALRQSNKRAERNKLVKRSMENAIEFVRRATTEGKKEEAAKLFTAAQQLIDKAAKVGVIKKNNASRKKARLVKKVNAAK